MVCTKHGLLECEQLGKVQLEQPHTGGPVHTKRSCIEAGSEQYDLAASSRARRLQVVVEVPRADRDSGDPRFDQCG